MRTLKRYLPIYFLATFMLLSFSPAVSSGLDQHIVGLWLFDRGWGDTAHDSSHYGNDGKIEGGAKWVDGMFQKALSFNGEDAYVEVPSSDSLEIEEEITIEFWFYPRTVGPGDVEILRKHQPDGNYNYEIYADGSGNIILWLRIADGADIGWISGVIGGNDIPIIPIIPIAKWTHLAYTYDGKKVVFYINGELALETDATGKIVTSDGPLYIGCRDGTRRLLDGILDELCISNIARTADEIKAHVEEGFFGKVSIEKAGKLAVTWAALKRK